MGYVRRTILSSTHDAFLLEQFWLQLGWLKLWGKLFRQPSSSYGILFSRDSFSIIPADLLDQTEDFLFLKNFKWNKRLHLFISLFSDGWFMKTFSGLYFIFLNQICGWKTAYSLNYLTKLLKSSTICIWMFKITKVCLILGLDTVRMLKSKIELGGPK